MLWIESYPNIRRKLTVNSLRSLLTRKSTKPPPKMDAYVSVRKNSEFMFRSDISVRACGPQLFALNAVSADVLESIAKSPDVLQIDLGGPMS